MLGSFEKLLKQVDNRARFLSGVLSGEIKCINRKKNEQRQEFVEKGFDPLPKEVQPLVIGGTVVKEETGGRPDVGGSDYDYLTSMSVSSLTEGYLHHLLELKRRLEIKVGLLRKAAPQCLKSEKEPTLLGRTCKKAQSVRDVMVDVAAKDRQASEAAPKRQLKRNASESLEASAVLMDDDEEEPPELKDQSQEHSEAECSQKQERNKQRKRRKKQGKESGETVARRKLDFLDHDESGDGYLMEEIKRIASGLDAIEITHRNRNQSIPGCILEKNRNQSMVVHELGKLSLRDASVSLCHKGVV